MSNVEFWKLDNTKLKNQQKKKKIVVYTQLLPSMNEDKMETKKIYKLVVVRSYD
jgi:hypothetical protein